MGKVRPQARRSHSRPCFWPAKFIAGLRLHRELQIRDEPFVFGLHQREGIYTAMDPLAIGIDDIGCPDMGETFGADLDDRIPVNFGKPAFFSRNLREPGPRRRAGQGGQSIAGPLPAQNRERVVVYRSRVEVVGLIDLSVFPRS